MALHFTFSLIFDVDISDRVVSFIVVNTVLFSSFIHVSTGYSSKLLTTGNMEVHRIAENNREVITQLHQLIILVGAC